VLKEGDESSERDVKDKCPVLCDQFSEDWSSPKSHTTPDLLRLYIAWNRGPKSLSSHCYWLVRACEVDRHFLWTL
jgi:hypothetical protein